MGKISKNKILVQLINNQLDDIENKKRLDVKSLQRISRNIEDSIFVNEDYNFVFDLGADDETNDMIMNLFQD